MRDEQLVLTRRGALQAGGAGAAAAFLLLNPWASRALAAAEASDVPPYLSRSSWLGVDNKTFAAGNTTLRLESVGDLPAATQVAALRGSEDAFTVTFSGARLDAGIHELRHSELGSFHVFVGQVGAPGDERLEVIVNRFPTPRRTPAPPRAGSTSGGRTPSVEDDADAVIRSITVRRGRRGARCVAKLDRGADTRELVTWLYRNDRVVAVTSRTVKRSRIEFNLRSAKRLRKGSYVVVAMTTDADGEQSFKRKRIKLR